MASKMSLGFVNDAHRGMRDAHSLVRQQVRARMPPPPSQTTDDAFAGGGGPGVVPLIETKPPPSKLTEPAGDSFARPRDSNTIERRIEYLVGQYQNLYDTLSTLQGKVRTLDTSTSQSVRQLTEAASRGSSATPASLLTIRATCVADAPQFEDSAGEVGEPMGPVAQGASLVLAYPMVRRAGAVLMRRMNVNPHTAAVTWTWIVLYQDRPAEERVFVSDFAC